MKTHCGSSEHLSRRALLKGSLTTSAGGVVMNWGGLFGNPGWAEEVQRQKKHCILLWMNGGASQFETFDMKVGRPTGGVFRSIATNVPGTQVCELMPHMAQQMDKIAVIRSMRTSEVDHPGGIYLMHTGYRPSATVRFPEVGAIVAKYQGRPGKDLPDFIKVSSQGDAGAGFLGPRYQPFGIGSKGDLPPFTNSSLAKEVESRRHELRSFVESQYTQDNPSQLARMHHEAYEAARRLQSVQQKFKLDAEWDKYRELYGDSGFGRRCLLARKLVESGVAFIEVGQSSYDSHADNASWHKGLVPPMEQAWAGLLTDLKDRGLLDNTLVVWTGEIGRTPKINNRAGRDHYVRCWSTALAGCGIKGGLVYGESDADGVEVKDSPVSEGDFFATIYQSLSINPREENFAGVRPVPLAPFGSKVVTDLLA
ncbi:MAG: DUF1501 domain-containing protein [Planctomycetaceae bacterium]|nr:DUF1501 domain-containing protein [Planctomycetaceae bacterium]